MIWLKLLARVLRVLREGATPAQIAGGFVLGFALGLIPGWPLHAFLLLALLLLLNVNLTVAGVGAAMATLIALALDPLIDRLGALVLEAAALKGLWTALYNVPALALTRFNNTTVMGSLVLGIVGGAIGFPLLVRGVRAYRERFLGWASRLWIVRFVTGSRGFLWLTRVASLGGKAL